MSSQRTVNNASVLGCSPEHSTYTICLCTEIWQRLLVNDMRDKTPPSMGVCYMFIAIPHMSETIFKNLWNLLHFFYYFDSAHSVKKIEHVLRTNMFLRTSALHKEHYLNRNTALDKHSEKNTHKKKMNKTFKTSPVGLLEP